MVLAKSYTTLFVFVGRGGGGVHHQGRGEGEAEQRGLRALSYPRRQNQTTQGKKVRPCFVHFFLHGV